MKYLWILALLPAYAFAETVIPGIPLSNPATLGALGIAVLVTQIVMFLIQSKAGDLAGKWKLAIMAGVSMVSAFLAQLVAGDTWLAALTNGIFITAVQNFVHQLITQSKAPDTKKKS